MGDTGGGGGGGTASGDGCAGRGAPGARAGGCEGEGGKLQGPVPDKSPASPAPWFPALRKSGLKEGQAERHPKFRACSRPGGKKGRLSLPRPPRGFL